MAPKKKNENKTELVLKKRKAKVAKAPVKKVLKPKCTLKKPKNAIVNTMLTLTSIDRMNEVAHAQLVKESQKQAPEVLKRKRGRKSKLDVSEAAEDVPKKKLKTTPIAQVRAKNTNKPKAVPPKQKAPPKKTPPKKTPPKKTPPKKTPPKKTPPKKTPPKKRGRPPTRRKPDDDTTITSPSILRGLLDTKTPGNDSQNTVLKPSVDYTVNNSDSRRTSLTSASELSWPKDISGSSTTTCKTVSSTDFVLIGGKLPKLELQKVDQVLKEEDQASSETNEMEHSLSEDSSGSSSSSSSSGSSSENTAVGNTLNLSTSSISPIPHSLTYTPVDQSFDENNLSIDVTSMLEILSYGLKSLELNSYIENDIKDFDMSSFEANYAMYLHEEHNTALEMIFYDSCNVAKTNAPEIQQNPTEETNFAKPDSTGMCNKSFCDNRNDVLCSFTRWRDTCDSSEDDDALSLHAESITFTDSGRLSSASSISCAAPNHEEYVPQAIVKRPYAPVIYQPTIINEPKVNQIESTIAKTKPVCEKQNADSTSIHKEHELDCTANSHSAPVNKNAQEQDFKQVDNTATGNDRPWLTISCYRYPPFTKSLTLRGVCFFNLFDSCSKTTCPFPHRLIDEDEFKQRLATLTEEQFFQEYTHIGKWPGLRRKFVKCFADECQRRNLPKILVEIVVDFLSKIQRSSEEDAIIKVQLIESALLYLNSWDLSVCEQLMICNVGGEVLCDVFMKIIGDTQNFSRFKNVFMNLAGFMVRVNRTFDLEVVWHILERVCILPFEAPLAARLISIIERTDRNIFGNDMMKWFELMLNNFNKELYNRLLLIKIGSVTNEGSERVSEVSPPSLPLPGGSRLSNELESLIINQNSAQDHDQRYTSPDTTNTDNMNKPVAEPVIIRTLKHLNPIRPNMRKPMQGPGPQNMFPRKWAQRSIMSQIPRIPHMRPQNRPMGRPLFSARPQFNFQRRYPPDFYGSGS